jgi:DNA-binding response OmpR family regulator
MEIKVLIIDDDIEFLRLITRIFESAGAQVITALDGLEGMSNILTFQPDLIILDVMLPGIDGFQICKLIRQFSNVPLIMLSGLDQEHLILQGLDAGADDILAKPLNPEILLGRVKAVLRRSQQTYGDTNAYNYNDGYLKFDADRHRILIGEKPIKLTPVEFRLLAYLLSNLGKVVSFEKILFNVWGQDYLGREEYVHVYISNLRSKIEEDPKKPRYIQTVHGVGYIFENQIPVRNTSLALLDFCAISSIFSLLQILNNMAVEL